MPESRTSRSSGVPGEEGEDLRLMRPDYGAVIAADLLWAFTSLRTWEDLVLVRGWTAAQYEERLFATLLRLLTNTPAPDRPSLSRRDDAVRSQRR